jgi:hypothetical protein
MMRRARSAWIAAGVAGLLAAGATTAASASAAAPPVAAPHWHIVESLPVKAGASDQFTAVVATGKTTAWAFNGIATPGGETAYQRTGGVWKKMSFPGKSTEYVAAAAATSPSNVWAFADDISFNSSRVLRWTGSTWAFVRSFSGAIWGASVLSSTDVWVFGILPGFVPAIGVWHYNGHGWTRVGKNISGGSVLNDHDVWGFTPTSIVRWSGHGWTATSVKSLLPAKNPLNDPAVVAIMALSDTNVYAFGSAGAQDEGGPMVVLHFNGHKWTKVATGEFGYGPDHDQVSSDGGAGLWIPMDGPVGGTSFLLHYAGGKLTKANVPINPALLTIQSVSRIPGTTQQLAGGYTHPGGGDRTPKTAVILQYS